MIDYEELYLKAMNRIVELEARNKVLTGLLDGQAERNDTLTARIVELEAALRKVEAAVRLLSVLDTMQEVAQQWHPASEPPKMYMHKDCAYMSSGGVCIKCGNIHDIEYKDWREPCPPNAPECEGNPAVCGWCRQANK